MKELHSERYWDQNTEPDNPGEYEAIQIVTAGNGEDGDLPEDLESCEEWFDDLLDDEFMDDDPITEEEAMDMARRLGGEW